jgi:tetratricopeptide (TPR) repeat protein
MARDENNRPTDGRTWFEDGMSSLELGQYPQAIEAFREAFMFSPAFSCGNNLAICYLASGDAQQALEWLNWCLSDNRCPPGSRPAMLEAFWSASNGRVDAYRDLSPSVNDL